MKQKAILFGIFLCLILAGIGGSYFVMHRQITNRTVVITQDGEELYRIAMDTIKEPYTIDILGEDGAWNRVLISKESVQMESASCPDGLCVHQGAISDGVFTDCLSAKSGTDSNYRRKSPKGQRRNGCKVG